MRVKKHLGSSLLALLVSAPVHARAGTCEGNVAKSGSFLAGQQFRVQAKIPQLNIDDAFRQLRAIYAISNIKVVGEDQANGVLKAETRGNLLVLPQLIGASVREEGGSSTLRMTYDIKPAELVSGRWIARHMCSVLVQIRGGASAQTVAPRPAARDTVTPIEASALARSVNAAAPNPAKLDVDFVGRRYQVSGRVLSILEARGGYAVWFEGLPPVDPSEPAWVRPQLAVKCFVPKQAAPSAAALTVSARGTLTGRFSRLDTDPRAPAVILQDCGLP
jgi:hypothetical protein